MRTGWAVALVLLFGLHGVAAKADFSGKVVSVRDGDTILVTEGGRNERRVRLAGIDAPELGQAYGRAAKDHLASLIAGKTVTIKTQKDDPHGRILGKVLLNQQDINLRMVEDDYAWWYRYFAKDQSRRDRKRYEQAEERAKAAKRGLWQERNPINPYDWRKANPR